MEIVFFLALRLEDWNRKSWAESLKIDFLKYFDIDASWFANEN